jgi:leucyl-tRNA synthetase
MIRRPFDDSEYNYWMPVDTYTGGSEHANMHLLYFRFFHKALRDMGITEGGEPDAIAQSGHGAGGR